MKTARAKKGLWEGLGTWLLSLLFMLMAPSFPLLIEAAKNGGSVRPESYFLTAAVLAASFGIASLHNIFRFAYGCVFLGTISLDFQPESGHTWIDPAWWSFFFMVLVATIQAVERFFWHVILNREFPDWKMEGV